MERICENRVVHVALYLKDSTNFWRHGVAEARRFGHPIVN